MSLKLHCSVNESLNNIDKKSTLSKNENSSDSERPSSIRAYENRRVNDYRLRVGAIAAATCESVASIGKENERY
ncbi:hypothetical protein GCM10007906_19460 [Vibrio hyugaensis]|uniref:Uncharacterized protein n=1 Tax=Vibrio hyugaensis TaxID=1534743 RepID=A0ABQ5Y1U2_9VIBR|nr:hypothetical protein GCM10007906_19460 [Vibrio hyugaensis]